MFFYELYEAGPSVLIMYIIICLVVTLVSYGAFPILFARNCKSLISKKKYFITCGVVNFIIMVFVSIFLGGSGSTTPLIIWTPIFCKKGLKMLEARGLLEGVQTSDTNAYQKANTTPIISVKTSTHEKEVVTSEFENVIHKHDDSNYNDKNTPIKFCRKCGNKLFEGSEFCSYCGIKVVKGE